MIVDYIDSNNGHAPSESVSGTPPPTYGASSYISPSIHALSPLSDAPAPQTTQPTTAPHSTQPYPAAATTQNARLDPELEDRLAPNLLAQRSLSDTRSVSSRSSSNRAPFVGDSEEPIEPPGCWYCCCYCLCIKKDAAASGSCGQSNPSQANVASPRERLIMQYAVLRATDSAQFEANKQALASIDLQIWEIKKAPGEKGHSRRQIEALKQTKKALKAQHQEDSRTRKVEREAMARAIKIQTAAAKYN